MVAMRPIIVDKEIAYDYAMVMHPNPSRTSYFSMTCWCGAANCRGQVNEGGWMKPELQKRYDGYFQWFLQEKILRSE